MAMAGYDPRQSLPFWERMEAQAANSQRPPEFYQLTQVQILEDQT